MKKLLALLLLLPGLVAAQPEHRPLVVMNLAAHPDDEDGRTLTYYRKAKDAIAYSVIYTRGEGGQNEIGPELYEHLGAIRTDETERAARILGTQVYFLNFKDFGFSKFASEAFEAWGGRDHVTARLVFLIRKLKPDLLFTNHDTVTVGERRQHGQHQAVGLSAWDAMRLAADPSYHPEQLEEPGVDLWQPKRLFLRHWTTPDSFDVAIPVGEVYEPDGRTYSEIATAALVEHASQGMGNFARGRGGPEYTYFTLLYNAGDTRPAGDDLAGNLPPNTQARPDLTYWIASGRLPALPDSALSVDDDVLVPGQPLTLTWHPATFPDGTTFTLSGLLSATLDPATGNATLTIPSDATPTVPKHVYQYERFRNHPPIRYAVNDAAGKVLAAGYLPVEIAPAIFAEPGADAVRLTQGQNELPVRVAVFDPSVQQITYTAHILGTGDDTLATQQWTRPVQSGVYAETLSLDLPSALSSGDYAVRLTAEAGAQQATTTLPARVFDVKVAPGLRVGIVKSYDDTMEEAMQELGVEYRMLGPDDLANARFDGLHTIVVDIRAYLVREDLRRHNDKLLAWVENGGHLIVNYHKTFEWNPGTRDPFDPSLTTPENGFAPYKIVLGRDRVTFEDAPVTVLAPDHLVVHAPNEIQPADWDGWVQERGLYFPQIYLGPYLELFEMNDPGEFPLRSSTLLAPYGRGTYLYTALVWYRQLKAFNPGAYRLFANLLSLPLLDERSGAAGNE